MPDWRPRPKEIPDSPGTYLFRDREGRVLYVGKAKSLRGRVPSYFGAGLGPRTEAMVEAAGSVEWIVTANEVAALQLEFNLIKEHDPRFNVRYRDDKSYPYLAVTLSEEIPRAIVTRGRKRKGDRYYGPYSHAYAIRDTLDLLLRVFPIRSCSKGVFDRARAARRPCLLYDIGRCSAPCVGHVSPQQHRDLVKRFCDFMDGDDRAIIKELRAAMEAASATQEYEWAARARDQIAAVTKVIERQEMVTAATENLDVVAFEGDELEAAFQVFFVRRGRVVGRRGFMVDRVEDLTDEELLASFLQSQYAQGEELPHEVLVPLVPAEPGLLIEFLTTRRGSRVDVRVPLRGSKRRLLETVARNAAEAFVGHRLRRASDFDARSRALSALQKELDLPEPPLRIECFDVSNLGPTEVVGSMVVFEDGLPKRSDYRKFRVRTVPGQDDVASLGEVIGRRFQRYREESAEPRDRKSRFAYEPALVVVDGGKGQLNRAAAAMSEAGVVDIPVVSLAKRFEEVFVPGETEPRIIPRGSEALYLLQRIRDEAHRVAVEYQRRRRSRGMTESALDALPGVGRARKSALLKHFGSVTKLRKASATQIAEIPGIGRELATAIYDGLRGYAS